MKKNRTAFIAFIILIIITASTYNGLGQSVTGIWSGTVRMKKVYTGELGTGTLEISTSFKDNKGSGTMKYEGEAKIGNTTHKLTCNGAGNAELYHLDISKDNDTTDIYTYYIHVIGPDFVCSPVEDAPGGDATDITIDDIVTGKHRNALNGVKTETVDNGVGTVTTTVSWDLQQNPVDVELIVTPEKYDTWLPEPGMNELSVGSVMNISFKLQAIGGGPTTKRAKAFELHFFNTSKEPGITINFPIVPNDSMPDLRFLVQPDAEIGEEFQSLKINCPGGCQSSKAKIGSYDGGGWTNLKVEAILMDDNTRIQGRLLVSNGDIDIRIPKREPNSKIGEAWLKKYNNPGEMDDKDSSRGNKNNGDGLTAYEEYRGVVAEGKFKRLNPNRKELGILANQTNFSLFNEGMGWFKSASELEIIRFDIDRNEIPIDNRLNQNAKSAHDFDQYVVYITNAGLGGTGTLGVCYGKRQPMIPANVSNVVIDWNYIQAGYQKTANKAKPATLKFTLKEYLAQTVAHELGHAVNIKHHGTDKNQGPFVYDLPANSNQGRIFDRNGKLVTNCHCEISNVGYPGGTVESGDMLCMLNYYPYYSWGYAVGADGAHIFNQEPLLPLGRKFCTSKDGTGINATNIYFGVATNGDCKGQIQLRN